MQEISSTGWNRGVQNEKNRTLIEVHQLVLVLFLAGHPLFQSLLFGLIHQDQFQIDNASSKIEIASEKVARFMTSVQAKHSDYEP